MDFLVKIKRSFNFNDINLCRNIANIENWLLCVGTLL